MSWFAGAKKPEAELDQPTDRQVIQGKLLDTEAQIASAEQELAQVSLAAALSDDTAAGADAVARLADLRNRKELLVAALKQAEQQERDAASQQAADLHATRRRSLAQRLGQFSRDAEAVQEAAAAFVEAYRKIAATGRDICATLPNSMHGPMVGYENDFYPRKLRELCMVELWRLSNNGAGLALLEQEPHGVQQYKDRISGYTTPLTQTLAAAADNVRAGFDKVGAPLAKPPVQPTEPAEPEQHTELPTIDFTGLDPLTGMPKPPKEMTANA